MLRSRRLETVHWGHKSGRSRFVFLFLKPLESPPADHQKAAGLGGGEEKNYVFDETTTNREKREDSRWELHSFSKRLTWLTSRWTQGPWSPLKQAWGRMMSPQATFTAVKTWERYTCCVESYKRSQAWRITWEDPQQGRQDRLRLKQAAGGERAAGRDEEDEAGLLATRHSAFKRKCNLFSVRWLCGSVEYGFRSMLTGL